MPRIPGKPNINTPAYWEDVYRKEIESNEIRDYRTRFDQIINQASRPDGLMLDFAGGTGEFAARFKKFQPNWDVFVYERAVSAANYGRRHHPDIEFLHEQPSWQRYHLIHCGQTLEHVDYPDALIAYLWGLLVHRGVLIVTVPNEGAIQDEEHVYEFDWNELYKMLPGANKDVVVMQDDRYLMGWAIKPHL